MPITSILTGEIFKRKATVNQSRAFSLRKSSALILLGILITYGIFILKVQIFHSPPVLFLLLYSAAMTAFQFGRLLTVLFYEESLERIRGKYSANSLIGQDPYEPSVSFVIPCMNEEKAIRHTINKCFEVDYPTHKVEVLVIDDGSTDKTPEILDQLNQENDRLTVIKFAQNRGKRYAMVEGFKRARGEIIVQLDSDSHLAQEGLRPLIEPFQNPSVGAACAHSDPANVDKNFLTKMQAAYYYMSFRILKAVESTFYTVFCCSGCASAYRQSAVLAVLDEWSRENFLGLPVMYGDDRSLTTRVIKEGYKTIYTAEAQAYTIVPETFRQLIIQQVRWKKSWIINAIKTGKFIITQKPFIAILYFYPLVILSLINPFVALYALVYVPIVYGIWPIFYLAGIFLITALIAVYYKVYGPQNRYWPYIFAWGAFSVTGLAPLLFYAAARIQNRSWGTR